MAQTKVSSKNLRWRRTANPAMVENVQPTSTVAPGKFASTLMEVSTKNNYFSLYHIFLNSCIINKNEQGFVMGGLCRCGR